MYLREVDLVVIDCHSDYSRVRYRYAGDRMPQVGVAATRHVISGSHLPKLIQSAAKAYREQMLGYGYTLEAIANELSWHISEERINA